jgi:hypothetical protein
MDEPPRRRTAHCLYAFAISLLLILQKRYARVDCLEMVERFSRSIERMLNLCDCSTYWYEATSVAKIGIWGIRSKNSSKTVAS